MSQKNLENQVTTIYTPRCCPRYIKHRFYNLDIKNKPRRFCCTLYKDKSNFQNIIQDLNISDIQKHIIRTRYLNILESFQRRARNYSYVYFSGHFIITVGSLFVPALLSIQNSDKSFTFGDSSDNTFAVEVYWVTIVISLLVTIFNGILTLFKVNKKYYLLNTSLERLRSEGWQYFSLTGRYASNNNSTTHENQFVYFSHYIEKIKMKQVEEEYYKTDVADTYGQNGQNGQGRIQELYHPSPDKPLNTMICIPEPVKDAVNSIIKSHHTIEKSI